MIEILEGSFFDVGPGVWAIVIVVALLVIEVFQLGPHTFTAKLEKDRDGRALKGSGGSKKSKGKKGGGKSLRRRKSGRVIHKTIKNYFQNNKLCTFIVLSNGADNFGAEHLVPDLNHFIQTKQIQAQSGSGSVAQIQSDVSYPRNAVDLKNYVVACGDEAEETVLDRLKDLWEAREKSKARNIFLYSWKIPSVYALQKMVALLAVLPDANHVDVGVLYVEEDPEDEMGHTGEKEDYLRVHGITLEKIDLL